MNLDWYYTFIILARTLNYRKASEEIKLTIPSVHKHIKNLEQHLNLKLFELKGKKLTLTNDGLVFLPIAQNFIHQYEDVIKYMQIQKSSYKINIKIVVSSYIATYILPKFLKIYLKKIQKSIFQLLLKMIILKKT